MMEEQKIEKEVWLTRDEIESLLYKDISWQEILTQKENEPEVEVEVEVAAISVESAAESQATMDIVPEIALSEHEAVLAAEYAAILEAESLAQGRKETAAETKVATAANAAVEAEATTEPTAESTAKPTAELSGAAILSGDVLGESESFADTTVFGSGKYPDWLAGVPEHGSSLVPNLGKGESEGELGALEADSEPPLRRTKFGHSKKQGEQDGEGDAEAELSDLDLTDLETNEMQELLVDGMGKSTSIWRRVRLVLLMFILAGATFSAWWYFLIYVH
jgi:hypothetical protein